MADFGNKVCLYISNDLYSYMCTCTVGVKKKPRFRSRSVPFYYGKTGDFFHSVFPVPFRRLARFRAHVYKFYISRERPIDRSSAKRQPTFQVA